MASPAGEGGSRPDESTEWLSHRVASWVETYKKSMLTPVILGLVARYQPTGIAAIAEAIARTTDWHVTERGLYRTCRRLQDSGLLISTDIGAPRTGAKKKELSLTPMGEEYLAAITENLVELPDAL